MSVLSELVVLPFWLALEIIDMVHWIILSCCEAAFYLAWDVAWFAMSALKLVLQYTLMIAGLALFDWLPWLIRLLYRAVLIIVPIAWWCVEAIFRILAGACIFVYDLPWRATSVAVISTAWEYISSMASLLHRQGSYTMREVSNAIFQILASLASACMFVYDLPWRATSVAVISTTWEYISSTASLLHRQGSYTVREVSNAIFQILASLASACMFVYDLPWRATSVAVISTAWEYISSTASLLHRQGRYTVREVSNANYGAIFEHLSETYALLLTTAILVGVITCVLIWYKQQKSSKRERSKERNREREIQLDRRRSEPRRRRSRSRLASHNSDLDSDSNTSTSEFPSSSGDNGHTAALSPPRCEWYWEDDKNQFTQYSQAISDTLTAAKLENPNKLCHFRVDGKTYLVDLSTMTQENIGSGYIRKVVCIEAQADTPYPPEWESQTSTNQLFMLGKYSREWIRITSKFKETMSEAEILSIQRIQNKWLWERYSQHKDRIRKKNDGVVNEKELWHGSRKSSSDNIYNSEEGFDMRFSSEGLWGQANYFAEKASYSDNYAFKLADGTKELLLARVLTGDSFESVPNRSLRMPPEKPSSLKTGNVQLKQLRYDSVSGTTGNCRVYMTYSNDKAYPAYLISYSTTPKPKLSYQLPPHYAWHRYKKI